MKLRHDLGHVPDLASPVPLLSHYRGDELKVPPSLTLWDSKDLYVMRK